MKPGQKKAGGLEIASIIMAVLLCLIKHGKSEETNINGLRKHKKINEILEKMAYDGLIRVAKWPPTEFGLTAKGNDFFDAWYAPNGALRRCLPQAYEILQKWLSRKEKKNGQEEHAMGDRNAEC